MSNTIKRKYDVLLLQKRSNYFIGTEDQRLALTPIEGLKFYQLESEDPAKEYIFKNGEWTEYTSGSGKDDPKLIEWKASGESVLSNVGAGYIGSEEILQKLANVLFGKYIIASQNGPVSGTSPELSIITITDLPEGFVELTPSNLVINKDSIDIKVNGVTISSPHFIYLDSNSYKTSFDIYCFENNISDESIEYFEFEGSNINVYKAGGVKFCVFPPNKRQYKICAVQKNIQTGDVKYKTYKLRMPTVQDLSKFMIPQSFENEISTIISSGMTSYMINCANSSFYCSDGSIWPITKNTILSCIVKNATREASNSCQGSGFVTVHPAYVTPTYNVYKGLEFACLGVLPVTPDADYKNFINYKALLINVGVDATECACVSSRACVAEFKCGVTYGFPINNLLILEEC